MARSASSEPAPSTSAGQAVHGYLARIFPALLSARRVKTNPSLDWNEVARLAEGIRGLSAGFTGTRDLPGKRYLADDTAFDAYLLYYFPITYAKVAQVLAEVPVPSRKGRALDLGSGPGPAALALGHFLGDGATVVAADREVSALGALRSIWRTVGLGQLQTFSWEAPKEPPGKLEDFDVIVVANLLNELFRSHPKRMEILFKWLQLVAARLTASGSLVLLEPALRETSRDLLQLRDRLAGAGLAIRAPCFWTGPCPALKKERDWCHASQPWNPPEWVRVLGEEAGISAARINFSYLVVSRAPASDVPQGVARVVSDALPETGKRKVWVCGDMGRQLVTRLDKFASVKNADFDAAERGDVVVLQDARPLGEELRLDGDSEFRIARRAVPRDLAAPKTEILIKRE